MTGTAAPAAAPVEVRGNDRVGRHVVATRAIAAGEVVASIGGARRVPVATRYTVQIGASEHIDGLEEFTCLNHSCAPNVVIETTALEIKALHDIAAGTELTYFYPSTEWHMAEPFECHCGALKCLGLINGAATLSAEVLSQYVVNEHIAALSGAAR